MPETKWAVAVTTAPRKDCTLNECIESIRYCGWEPIVFAEPESSTTDCFTITNEHRLGVWHNWLSSVRYCLNNTDANVIMTVQDDTFFHPESKTFAEKILWPDPKTGFISLYTPRKYSFLPDKKTPRKQGVMRIITRSLWGACCLIFPRKVLEDLVQHPATAKWIGASVKTKSAAQAIYQRRRENPYLIANSDTAIGQLMNRMGRTMWFTNPSLVSHIAEFSTINHGGNTGSRNCLKQADFDTPLEDQIPLPKIFTLA